MLKRLFLPFIFAALLGSLSVSDALACSQGGQCTGFGGCNFTQYLYNFDFSEGCAWSYTGGTSVTASGGTQMCNLFPSYLTLGYNGGAGAFAWQFVTIPTSQTGTHWTLGFNLEAQPTSGSSPGLDTFFVRVYDVTTASDLVVTSAIAANSSPSCRLYTASFTGDLHGHQIEVLTIANVVHADAHFYVTSVSLDGGP